MESITPVFPLRRYFFYCVTLFFLSFSCIYLVYHGFYGQRGYFVYEKKKKILMALGVECENIDEAIHKAKSKNTIFKRNIDLDLLEQYAWIFFRKIDPQAKVIYVNEEDSKEGLKEE